MAEFYRRDRAPAMFLSVENLLAQKSDWPTAEKSCLMTGA